jgi:phenylalanyl-tRNA synthetase beta chain
MVAAGVRAGRIHGRHWSERTRPVDAYDAKGDAIAALEAAGAPVANLQVSTDAPGWYHPGRSGQLRLGPVVLARFGELHPRVLKGLDAKGPMVAFEILMDAIPTPKAKGTGKTRGALHASALQPVTRDFAFVVDEGVEADQVRRAANAAEKQLISDVSVFDVYRGAELGEGRKSVAIQVTLQPREATLTDQELEAIAQRITAGVAKQTGGTLRG